MKSFSGGVYVGKNTAQSASVRIVRKGGRSVRAADCDLHVGKARRAFSPRRAEYFGKAITGPSLAVSTRAPNAAASVIASSERLLRFISMPDFLRPFIKRGIVDAVGLDSGGDTSDPQAAEISLLQLAANICINAGLLDGLLGHFEVGGLGTPVGLCQLQGLISSLARHHRAFYSCHLFYESSYPIICTGSSF